MVYQPDANMYIPKNHAQNGSIDTFLRRRRLAVACDFQSSVGNNASLCVPCAKGTYSAEIGGTTIDVCTVSESIFYPEEGVGITYHRWCGCWEASFFLQQQTANCCRIGSRSLIFLSFLTCLCCCMYCERILPVSDIGVVVHGGAYRGLAVAGAGRFQEKSCIFYYTSSTQTQP